MNLYDIVIVERDNWRHYGEVLSRLTPDGTYMVRMIPGHPGTLIEMPINKLSYASSGRVSKSSIKWIHYAEVTGPFRNPRSFNFPIDMLRYDYAAPLNFNLETGKIDLTFGFAGLVVARASNNRYADWHVARWNSFLWQIKDLQTLPFEKAP